MNDGAYAGLRRTARAAAPGAQSETLNRAEPKGEADTQHKDQFMTEEEHKAALAEAKAQAKAEGFAEANARTATVLASDEYEGREPLAQALLANDKLSAEEIVASLAKAERKAPAVAAAEAEPGAESAAEVAARAEMKDAIAASSNSNVDAGGAAAPADKKSQADSVWDRANAAVGRTKKEG